MTFVAWRDTQPVARIERHGSGGIIGGIVYGLEGRGNRRLRALAADNLITDYDIEQ